MAFHRALVKRKYRLLVPPRQHRKPGPKGPARELITAIVEMKRRNPRFGCRRIAQQLSFIFGVEIERLFSLRVTAPKNPLGAGRGGPVHPQDRRLRRPCGPARWSCHLSYVQPCNRWGTDSTAPPQQRS